MEKEDKVQFIENFLNNMKEKFLKEINSDKIPEDWNGLHLRVYISEAFKGEAEYSKKSLGRKGIKDLNNSRYTIPLTY